MEKTTMEKTTAEVKVKAAKLRVLAANQRAMAAGYRRQAEHPVYPGQDLICLAKADEIAAKAAQSEAEADMLKAVELEDIAKRLETVCGRLEKTRSSFKSATVAEARKEIEQLVVQISNMI